MVFKNKKLIWGILAGFILLTVGCAKTSDEKEPEQDLSAWKNDKEIVIGFSQLGAESDWRSANTQSMKETFTTENGYRLLFEDGQQKQANQIMAIRTFIQQEVDYIVLAPVTETGWDTVLQEAKDANIPVIIVDRMVDVSDRDLFTCWIGSDFELEGKRMAKWLQLFAESKNIDPKELHIVNIQGNIGASAQIGRTKGLQDGVKQNGWDLLDQVPADFTQTKGKEVMESFLKKYPNLNVVYCENDNEALGAIEAIKEAGKIPGPDIKNGEILVVSFDGVNEKAIQCVLEGEIQCIAECNPLQGSRVETVIELLESGKTPQKFSYVKEDMYVHDNTVVSIAVDGTVYPVTVLTQ